MHFAEIEEVIKASPAIQIQSKVTLLQRRAWNVLLANAYNELPNREVHSISVAQLGAKLGFNDKHANQSYLKESLRSLRYCEVEWNILEKDKEMEWGVAGLLAEVRIKEGICFYQFPHTLRANYPNPFNPETWIPYELATDTTVTLTIYNAQGVVVRTLQLGQQSAGYYTDRERAAYWDGRNALGEQVASGLYFYQLETDAMSLMRKMVILK